MGRVPPKPPLGQVVRTKQMTVKGNPRRYECHWYCMKCGREWHTIKPRSLDSELPTVVEAITLSVCHHTLCGVKI